MDLVSHEFLRTDNIVLEFNDLDDLDKEIRCVRIHVCI